MAKNKHHRKSHKKRSSKNLVMKSIDQSVNIAKSTSKKYMPKVKSGLEGIGSKVVKTGETTIPYLQQMTRRLFSMFSKKNKTRKNSKK